MKSLIASLLIFGSIQAHAFKFTTTTCMSLQDFLNDRIARAMRAEDRLLSAETLCKGKSARCVAKLQKRYVRTLENVASAQEQYIATCK